MKKYLCQVSAGLKAKNKLQAAIQKYILGYERRVINKSDFNIFRSALHSDVMALVKEYPHCTPDGLNIFTPDNPDDRVFHFPFISMHLVCFEMDEPDDPITEIKKLKVETDEILVIRFKEGSSTQLVNELKEQMENQFSYQAYMILPDSIEVDKKKKGGKI